VSPEATGVSRDHASFAIQLEGDRMSEIAGTTETTTIRKGRRHRSIRPKERFSVSLTATRRAVAGLLVMQCVFVFAFVYPGYEPKPHHLPVGVVAPTAAVNSIAAQTGSGFALIRYPTQQAARAAIDNRHIYGAVIVSRSGRRLLVASAASFTVSQFLRQAISGATVEDVKPLDPNDPRGATIGLLLLPLVTVCFGVVLKLGALRLNRKAFIGATIAFAALGGLAVAATVHFGLGALPGTYLELSAITALTILALVLPIAGLHRLLGPAGLVVSGFLFFVFANTASGNATAPQLLPSPWRVLGQLLPPGAGGTALRNTGYFGDAALAQPILVLASFSLAGALLVLGADRLRGTFDRTPSRSTASLQRVPVARARGLPEATGVRREHASFATQLEGRPDD
jgi:hypothetical protein